MVDVCTVLEDTEKICAALSQLKSANMVSHEVAVFLNRKITLELEIL